MNLKTSTTLILTIILMLAVVGGYIFVYKHIFGLVEKTNALKNDLRSKEILLAHEQDLTISADTTANNKKTLDKFFISKDGAIEFVSLLENSAGRMSLQYVTNSIENMSFEVLTAQDKDLLRLEMSLFGTWGNTLRFLGYLESLPYAVRIEKADLTENGGVWRLNVTFSTIKYHERNI